MSFSSFPFRSNKRSVLSHVMSISHFGYPGWNRKHLPGTLYRQRSDLKRPMAAEGYLGRGYDQLLALEAPSTRQFLRSCNLRLLEADIHLRPPLCLNLKDHLSMLYFLLRGLASLVITQTRPISLSSCLCIQAFSIKGLKSSNVSHDRLWLSGASRQSRRIT